MAGIPLDVFVYPARYFEGAYACEDFVQIFDGRVIMDRHDIGKSLLANVQAYLQNRPEKTSAEIQANIDWCVKMSARAKRCDCEGAVPLALGAGRQPGDFLRYHAASVSWA